MKVKACSRLWEVEAFHERRLHRESASFERHIARCGHCKSELSELRRLTESLRALPVRPTDEVSVRRNRQQLLADAYDAPGRGGLGAERRRRPTVFAALAVASLLLGVVLWRSGAREPDSRVLTHRASSARTASEASIVAATGTRWTRHRMAKAERVDLVDGELAVEVHRRDEAEQVIVVVPDGELEDIGTRFVVNVSEGTTKQIVVSEGSIVFRRRDGRVLRLDAPTTWTSASEAPTDPSVAAKAKEAASAMSTVAMQAPPPSSVVGPPKPTAAAILAEANEARRTGDHGRAIALHRRLQSAFPASREAHASCGILGRLLLDDGDAASALESFDTYRARGHGPLDESVLVGRATALERLGRSDEAKGAWASLLATFPDSPYADHARRRADGGTSR